ncbi:putative MscS Mechanosensitive ion channel [Mesorhizobium metallidurans STM 2683]|uniref:Putative MscS Mechanosensitive ion channel n=1 Tax=Mesorhizobium metallidurans STM 2683 TaxID=1297569 RepID=M5EJ39_9HYPH|nr:mechanosensitive ion channel family protein [Mesorhizobium metallidurans]CCV04123.1 putative MscS Mechanosensitive ion channel [Mesorhizobium metallidurans STM 2683]
MTSVASARRDRLAPVLMRIVALIASLAFFGLLPFPQPAHAQETANWTGIWDTKWRGGGAQIKFEQNGAEVKGVYPLYNGRIEAKAAGDKLVGRWFEGARQGDFTFVQAPDGGSFMGRFEAATAEWWTGVRVGAVEDLRVDQASPMTTMRSFLQTMNESGADNVPRAAGGGMGLAALAAGLIDVTEADRGGLNMPDYTKLLFTVIDKATFRLWSLPHDTIPGNEVGASLQQYGTKVAFDVTFRRKNDEWFIVGPPLAALQAKLAEFQAARGEAVDLVDDPSKLASPRDTFKVLLSGVIEAGDPAKAALDLRDYNPAVRSDEAFLLERYLKKVIDRIGYVYWQEIPDDPKSNTPYVYFEHPSGNIVVGPVETDKVGDADGQGKGGKIWQFTPETLANIRTLYADVEDVPVAPEFAAFASNDPFFLARGLAREISPGLLTRAGPMERWQWWMLGLAALVGIAFGFVANAVITFFARGQDRSQRSAFFRVVEWAVRSIFLGLFLLATLRPLGLPQVVAAPVKAAAWSLIVIGAVPVVWHLIGRIADHYRKLWQVPGYHDTLISLSTGVTRVAVLVVAFLLLAEVLAIPYEGVIAGLGIGGLAVALAAQPTLQNFLSGLTLYADRPVSVGDFCKFGDQSGTIEHIGMRSTRIRSLDRTVISVPNSDFAGMQIENYAHRDRTRFATTLQLRYETTPDQLRYTLAALRKLLIAHPRVIDDPCRVRFVGFGPYSLDIEVFTYIMTADWSEFLAIREDILLAMINIMDEAGAQFAFPSQLEYSAADLPVDDEKRVAAETRVNAWRDEENLPFPDFSQIDRLALNNTHAYPPRGSAHYRETEPDPASAEARATLEKVRWSLPWKTGAA